jgi:tetratricopeptide (TPR) repeat protein
MATAEDAIALAECAGEIRPRLVSRDFRAHLLNRAGRLRDSRAVFEEVERIRIAEDHDGELSHYPEASFAALLVEMGEPEEACRRARRALEQTSEANSERNSLLNVALSKRSLARALAAIGHEEEADRLFEDSIADLQRAGRRDHLAPGLVDRARSQMLRHPDRARSDLEEALRIATQGGFRLVEADAHLNLGRLAIEAGCVDEAERSLREARVLLEDTGFALRKPTLLLAEARLHTLRGDRHAAELALRAAQQLVEAWSMLGLRTEIDRTASFIHAPRGGCVAQ